MSDNRRYQLENLEMDISERFRFTRKRLDAIDPTDTDEEDDLAFYAYRARRLNSILKRIHNRVSFLIDFAAVLD